MDDHLHLPSSASRLELKKGKKGSLPSPSLYAKRNIIGRKQILLRPNKPPWTNQVRLLARLLLP
jgi:hypothetical protein